MKHLAILALLSSLIPHPSSLSAAVPLTWTVDMRRAQPATFEAYQGETLAFEASLMLDGKPFEAPSNYSFFWQTNGMGSTYWEVPVQVPGSSAGTGTSHSNLLRATWLPSYDVGARVYNCFIGSPSNNYHTAFQLRLRPSPGATPNALPLPVPVIDFAKVRVLNPPWGAGGFDTNAVIDIIHKTVDGAARPLPKYLWLYEADDSYPEAAEEYYRSRGDGKTDGGCSSVRSGGFLSRNFDFPFDDRAEFVVKMSAGTVPPPFSAAGASRHRFASVGVAQVGTNLTEAIVTSGKPSRCYKWLPGATVDGINENGVACNINVVDGDPQWGSDVSPLQALHPLAAIRWILDNATNAQHAATYIASHIVFPPGWTQNYHYMVADESSTYIVENGTAYPVPPPSSAAGASAVLTNFRLYPTPSDGEGQERYVALTNGANITSQWWTLTYTPTGYRPSDLPGITGQSLANLFNYWASEPREAHRGESFDGQPWWQSVHTSVYDITNKTMRIAVQEVDDWYVFAVPSSGVSPVKVREIAAAAVAPVASSVSDLASSVSGLESSAVKVTEQIFTKEQKAQARANIGAGTSNVKESEAFSGNAFFADFANGASEAYDLVFYAGGGYGCKISFDMSSGRWKITDLSTDSPFLLEPAPDISGKFDEPSASSVTNGHVAVFKKVTNPDDTVTVKVEDGGEIPVISSTDATFTNAVLQTIIPGLSTNITEEVYIAATNACAKLGIDPSLIPQEGTIGTVGGLLVTLAAAVALLRKKTSLLKTDGTAEDDFATDLLGKSVAIQKIDERLPIQISEKNAGFTTESYKRFVVTVGGNITVTLHTPTAKQGGGYDAEVFECRFDGASLAADASVAFDGATATTMDTNCGTVTAGKVALMSAFWNGSTWDVNWKVEG